MNVNNINIHKESIVIKLQLHMNVPVSICNQIRLHIIHSLL